MKTGYNGLFIPGPTNIPNEIVQAMTLRLEDMRAPDFGAFTLALLEDLKKVFKTTNGQPMIFPASGTGGWESALTNTLSPGDKILCSAFGQFSHLWADMCARLGFEVVRLDVEWGKGVPVEDYARILAEDTGHTIKAVLACHNETATGVTSDIAGVRKALDDAGHPAMLFVDGVSSLASIDFRMDEWGVDVMVSGSQKGFMLPTGLAIICVSQKALEAHKASSYPRCFFSWEDMQNSFTTGYFPYTPATTLLRGLRCSLDMLFAEGLDNVFARHNHLATGVRKAVDAWGLKLCAQGPQWHSDTVSAIMVPEGHDATKVIARAYERYNTSLGSGLSQVAGKVFRIGHLGWLNEIMILQAIATAEMAMGDSGIPVELGSGVAAAQAHFMNSNFAS
ncbi:MAG: aminotransferase class V-fold PLP-dependent enzyme [Rhodobiaceae bacterium]|nr:aminotransferase class V-fold PLP-dependent enzyme [Rhodobiaceae bacterium]MCC0041110.1 aminotransferase class V-fold PLP-dependent enzyme [Rhodobiaceae bacterium]